MIPKNIFLIWFGDYVPQFVKANVKHYEQLNVGFNVIFIHRTLSELQSIKNGCIKHKYDEMIYNSYIYLTGNSKKYQSCINFLKKYHLAYDKESLISLSDIFRLELLNRIGGIYVDCDVFQIRPFDDYLISQEKFVVKVHHTDTFFSTDDFFMGSIPNRENNYMEMPFLNPINCTKIVQTNNKWYTNIQYIKNRKYFYDINFEAICPAFNNNFYIEHYTKRYM